MKLMKLVKVLIGHISETVNQFCMLQNGHTTSYENKLDDLLLCLHLLLISSAECERCMNHTNALEVITIEQQNVCRRRLYRFFESLRHRFSQQAHDQTCGIRY
jgi:hypothetical protein